MAFLYYYGDTLLQLSDLYFSIFQHIEEIPDDLKPLYKTVWEISQRTLVDMAADRGAFIDQSQSFNVFFAEPNPGKLTSMHFYGWRKVSQYMLVLGARGDTQATTQCYIA